MTIKRPQINQLFIENDQLFIGINDESIRTCLPNPHSREINKHYFKSSGQVTSKVRHVSCAYMYIHTQRQKKYCKWNETASTYAGSQINVELQTIPYIFVRRSQMTRASEFAHQNKWQHKHDEDVDKQNRKKKKKTTHWKRIKLDFAPVATMQRMCLVVSSLALFRSQYSHFCFTVE